MTKQQQRERFDFENRMRAEGLDRETINRLLRASTTLDRLAVAMCNGDWPCDNGERETVSCDECEMGYAPESLVQARRGFQVTCPHCGYKGIHEQPIGECPQCHYWPQCADCAPLKTRCCIIGGTCAECRTQARVRAMLPAGFEPVFGGDPRGCVLKLKVPSGRTDDWGHEGVCVPSGFRG